MKFPCQLYLIEILHQTTTSGDGWGSIQSCILSKFYIKPQQRIRHKIGHSCCILSKFYIKPQLRWLSGCSRWVVSYRNSTSNHNGIEFFDNTVVVVSYRNSTSNHNSHLITSAFLLLYLIEILHQTTTETTSILKTAGCILSKFYIKPQRSC